jgi:hypothetical protein
MRTMEDFWLNLARPSRRIASKVAIWSVLLPFCAAAAPAAVCQKTPAARQDALLVVDAAYHPVSGQTLQIGDINFSVLRDIKRRFLIVAPLRAQPTSSLDGAEIHSDLELLQKCPGKNVFALNFSFDGSTLQAGPFSAPLSVYQDEFGMKGAPLSAPIRTVVGTVKRFWIQADLSAATKSPMNMIVLRLTNSGNERSAPMRFPTLEDMPGVHVGVNECEARLLAPAETCAIELAIAPSTSKRISFEWPVDVGELALLTLQFESRHGAALNVEARNR